MTSYRQVEANRRSALKSTGPLTEAGKKASRRNAVRHGLTAETIIGTLEDAEDYTAFEAAIIADYDAQSGAARCKASGRQYGYIAQQPPIRDDDRRTFVARC